MKGKVLIFIVLRTLISASVTAQSNILMNYCEKSETIFTSKVSFIKNRKNLKVIPSDVVIKELYSSNASKIIYSDTSYSEQGESIISTNEYKYTGYKYLISNKSFLISFFEGGDKMWLYSFYNEKLVDKILIYLRYGDNEINNYLISKILIDQAILFEAGIDNGKEDVMYRLFIRKKTYKIQDGKFILVESKKSKTNLFPSSYMNGEKKALESDITFKELFYK